VPQYVFNAVNAGPDLDAANEEALTEDDVAQINAIRARNGKPPFRPKTFGKPSNASRGPVTCFYCKKIGHMQKDCRKRIADRAPMVNAQGKPLPRRVAAVTEGPIDVAPTAPPSLGPAPATSSIKQDHHVGAVVAELNSLNW